MVVVVVVDVEVDFIVEGILLAQHPSTDLHSSGITQPLVSAQNKVPSGLHGVGVPVPSLQIQYLGEQHPSDRKVRS